MAGDLQHGLGDHRSDSPGRRVPPGDSRSPSRQEQGRTYDLKGWCWGAAAESLLRAFLGRGGPATHTTWGDLRSAAPAPALR